MKWIAALSAALFLAACGSGNDCATPCNNSPGGEQVCPQLTKQCPGFTKTVQQCTGIAGEPQGCCTTDAAQISC